MIFRLSTMGLYIFVRKGYNARAVNKRQRVDKRKLDRVINEGLFEKKKIHWKLRFLIIN